MRKIFFLLTSILLLTACNSNTIYKKPDDLIPKDQMINLLTDMYLANAAKSIKTKKLERNLDYMPLVYEKYGIDSLRFQKSNFYYMSRIDEYEAIYKKVENRLKEMLDTTRASKKLNDSLKREEKKKKNLKESVPIKEVN